jgi:nucleotide-binding universal stress UspA family protein
MSFPRRFLVPTDFSVPSERALECAVELAKQHNGYVLLLHVVHPPRHLLPESHSGEASRLADSAREHAGHELTKAAERHKERGVPVNVAIKTGVPWRVIVETAQELDLDIVVMGRRGHPEVPHLMGGVAEKVVRMSPRPVLTVPGEST